jgi:hypothetical protein
MPSFPEGFEESRVWEEEEELISLELWRLAAAIGPIKCLEGVFIGLCWAEVPGEAHFLTSGRHLLAGR